MKQKNITAIDTELGKWDVEGPAADYALSAIFEQSNTTVGFQLPNPDRKLSILARPNGLHITSANGPIHKDFALPYHSITSVQMLPTYTVHTKKSISLLYVVAFAFFAWLMGTAFDRQNQSLSLLYVLLGAIFGAIFSLAEDNKYKRRNIMIAYQEGNADNYLLLSIYKNNWAGAVNFFLKFCPAKLVQ